MFFQEFIVRVPGKILPGAMRFASGYLAMAQDFPVGDIVALLQEADQFCQRMILGASRLCFIEIAHQYDSNGMLVPVIIETVSGPAVGSG